MAHRRLAFENDCFPDAYGVPIGVPLPAIRDPNYPRNGVRVIFPAAAPAPEKDWQSLRRWQA